MRSALIDAGLFDKEADAMLDTWESAYFRSPGLRLFFILPQAWVDRVLPLGISRAAEIRRVMIGRVELISPSQRALIERIAAGPVSQSNWLWKAMADRGDSRDRLAAVFAGRAPIGDLNLEVPSDYQAYVDLGRFRNALLLDEHARRPTTPLGTFIERYAIRYADVD